MMRHLAIASIAVLLALQVCSVLAGKKPSYVCYQLDGKRTLKIDGDLSDWPKLPILLLGRADQVGSGVWGGPEDSHAKIRMTWDKQKLYMAIEVVDDKTTQNLSRDHAYRIYTQDSLQWAVDLDNDGGESYGKDNYEYGFGVADGKPIAYRWYSSGGWPKGVPERVDLAIKPRPQGGLIYEAAVDWSMLAPLRNPKEGKQIGFTILLQDCDNSTRKTLQWTPGVASGKRPSAFGKVTFSRATPSDVPGGVLISAGRVTGADGLDVTVMSGAGDSLEGPLFWQLRQLNGLQLKVKPLQAQKGGLTFTGKIPTKDLTPGEYEVVIKRARGKALGKHKFTRCNVEELDNLMAGITEKSAKLKQLIDKAKDAGLPTHYPLATLTAANVFEPFIKEDIQELNFELALYNMRYLNTELAKSIEDLESLMANPKDVPAKYQLPDLDYTKTEIQGRHLMVDDHKVLLIGPGTWLWQAHRDINNIADMGYNQVKFGWQGQHHFGDDGKLKSLKELPFWAANDLIKAAKAKKMSVGMEMMCPDQAWRGISKGGDLSVAKFHDAYDKFAAREIPRLGVGKLFDHTISVEGQRAQFIFDPKLHQGQWVAFLKSQYQNIGELNGLYGKTYASFNEVPFPEKEPVKAAPRYDWVRFRQIQIANELARAANLIRKYDPGVKIHGYPYVWSFREAGAYYGSAIDPELDTACMDMVGCDMSFTYDAERYLLPTVNWMAGYYDLMRSIAQDRPLVEGEFHYVNRRRIYPENWARAIYFQAYMHGISSSYSWVWIRSGSVDCSLLLDAAVLLDSGRVALDLRRTAESVVAFQDTPDDIAILYSNASSPQGRRTSDGRILSQTVQTNNVYEGIFFEGMQVGFITEQKIGKGMLAGKKLLIVPNSSHVERATRNAIEAFAKSGGEVVMVGDALTYTPQGAPQKALPNLPNVTKLEGFANVDQARKTLVPILKQKGVLPKVRVAVENGLSFPTVEWRRATDAQGRRMLFVLNLGHDQATVTLPDGFSGTDLLNGESCPSQFDIKPLEFRLLRESGK